MQRLRSTEDPCRYRVHQGKIPTDQPCPSPEQEERCEKGEVLNTRKKPKQIVSKNEAPGESNITHTMSFQSENTSLRRNTESKTLGTLEVRYQISFI